MYPYYPYINPTSPFYQGNQYNPYIYPMYQQPMYQQQNPIQHPTNQELGDEEVLIGSKKIGMGSKIKLNVKTTLWILGLMLAGLSTLYTWTWLNEKNNREEDYNKLTNKIEEIKGEVGQINERTARIEGQLDPVLIKTAKLDEKPIEQGGNIQNDTRSTNTNKNTSTPPPNNSLPPTVH